MATRAVATSVLNWSTSREGRLVGGTIQLPTSLATMVLYHLSGDVVTYIADPTVALKTRTFRLLLPGERYDNASEAPLGATAGRVSENGLIVYSTG